jgi:hypothetical protein
VLEAMVWVGAGDGEGLEREAWPMPDVPDPSTLPSMEELLFRYARVAFNSWPRPLPNNRSAVEPQPTGASG